MTQEKITLHFSHDALKAQRAKLERENRKEYQTRGNTARCQELWAQIEAIDAEIERRFGKEGK